MLFCCYNFYIKIIEIKKKLGQTFKLFLGWRNGKKTQIKISFNINVKLLADTLRYWYDLNRDFLNLVSRQHALPSLARSRRAWGCCGAAQWRAPAGAAPAWWWCRPWHFLSSCGVLCYTARVQTFCLRVAVGRRPGRAAPPGRIWPGGPAAE